MLQTDSSTVYIKKLIKIIYEKQKQIEQFKKASKGKTMENFQKQKSASILDQQIKSDIDFTSTQIKAATIQMTAMEQKINELQLGLRQQSMRNLQYENQIMSLREQNISLKGIIRENQSLKQSLSKLEQANKSDHQKREQIKALKFQNQNLSKQITNLKKKIQFEAQKYVCLSQILKRYEEFTYEIGNHIDKAHAKHCRHSHSVIRSSQNLIKGSDLSEQKFQQIIKKFINLQAWTLQLEYKLERVGQNSSMVNETVENLSMIVKSFEEKLENNVQMTERQNQIDAEINRNQQLLLQNLQMECEASKNADRSKVVELEEVRQVLLMTKQVNNKLYDDLSRNEMIIKQFRSSFSKLFQKGKSKIQFSEIQKIGKLLGMDEVDN